MASGSKINPAIFGSDTKNREKYAKDYTSASLLNESPEVKNIRMEVFRTINFMDNYYRYHIWKKWIKAWKDYLLNKIDRQIEIQTFQSNMKVPVTRQYVNGLWKSVFDNTIDFRVSGRTKEDHRSAEAEKDFLDWAFSRSDARQKMMQAGIEAMIAGNGYVRTGFVSDETKFEYYKGTKKEEIIRRDVHPTLEYESIFDIMIDPTADNIETSRYVVSRKIMYKSAIIKRYKAYIPDIEDQIGYAQIRPFRFWAYDFSRVKYLAFYGQMPVNEQNVGRLNTANNQLTDDLNVYYKNYLTINYEGGYSEVIEYWEDDRLVILIDGRVVYCDVNPLPTKRKPFRDIYYNKIAGIPFGMGLGITMSDIQDTCDTVMNLTIDNMKLQVAPMFQKIKGGDVFADGQTNLQYEPFKIWEVNTPGAISRLDLGTPDFTGTQFVNSLIQLADMSEGVNSYMLGSQGKVERSATGVSALVQASKASLLPFIDSMNRMLAGIAEDWSILGATLMPEDDIIKIEDENGAVNFRSIKAEDLLAQYDLEFDAQALKTASRETRRAQLLQLIPLIFQYGTDPQTGKTFVNAENLWQELLDSFELSPSDLMLTPKQSAEKSMKAQLETQKVQQKYAGKMQQGQYGEQQYGSQQYGQPNTGAPVNGISPVEGEAAPQIGEEPQLSPEAELLKEANQY